MSIIGAFMVPHPPLIIPAVGKGEESGISATIAAYDEVGRRVAKLHPHTIVITSPHTVLYADYFHISPGASAFGSFAQFRAGQIHFQETYDTTFTAALAAACEAEAFPAGFLGEKDAALDHGTMVPLHFVEKYTQDFQLVRIGLSGLPLAAHYRLGQLLADTADRLDRTVVLIASGDLSHKLKSDGPYGYDPAGPAYDERIMDVMGRAAFGELFDFSEAFCCDAAECGHRSFVILAGALDGRAVAAETLSHEGPFGVGYGICAFTPKAPDRSRQFLSQHEKREAEAQRARREQEDPFVRLARQSLETYVRTGKRLPLPAELPPELTDRQAGAFVSLKQNGQLRGCIGTISPTRESLASEILQNAISAGTRDPRFPPVTEQELPELVYSVDVLSEAVPVDSEADLDPKRYGVIVSKGGRRGLLLPDLANVDTAAEQVKIAKQKAGLSPDETGVQLERFCVVRHH